MGSLQVPSHHTGLAHSGWCFHWHHCFTCLSENSCWSKARIVCILVFNNRENVMAVSCRAPGSFLEDRPHIVGGHLSAWPAFTTPGFKTTLWRDQNTSPSDKLTWPRNSLFANICSTLNMLNFITYCIIFNIYFKHEFTETVHLFLTRNLLPLIALCTMWQDFQLHKSVVCCNSPLQPLPRKNVKFSLLNRTGCFLSPSLEIIKNAATRWELSLFHYGSVCCTLCI